MIKKLRRKFIVVTMLSTFAVLLIIIGALNIANYVRLYRNNDSVLSLLLENEGAFPGVFLRGNFDENKEKNRENPPEKPDGEEILHDFGKPGENEFPPFMKQDKDFRVESDGQKFLRETAYETRFFTVGFDANGTIINENTGNVSAIPEEDVENYALRAFEKYNKKNISKGTIDGYRWGMKQTPYGSMVVFIDISSDLFAAKNVLLFSILLSCVGLFCVFVLVAFFSKKIFKPVEESYIKQKRFITDASHELKTPLTIISANVEVLEMESEENTWSKSIKNQVGRMTGLVEDMVSLARMDEERALEKTVFSLSDAVRETADLYKPLAISHNQNLTIDIKEGISYEGDEKKIRQMVGLLLDNSVKYASAEGGNTPEIMISLKQKGKKAQIIVFNTTDQVSAGNQEVLFERFYRPDSSRNSKKGGSGIGLSIVKSIVEAHKGKITAISKDGKSIQFEIVL